MPELTDRGLRTLKPADAGKRLMLWESIVPGLAARVTDTGKVSFVFMKRVAGGKTPRRITLGRFPAMSLADARKRARGILELVAQGKDPAQEIAHQRAAEERRRAETFGAVAEAYLERHAKRNTRPGTFKETKRVLDFDVRPAWRDRPITSITRRDVTALLHDIVDRGAPVQANRTFMVVRKLFNWAVGCGFIEQTPVAQFSMPTKERPRDRALDDAELRAFWTASGDLGWPFGHVFRLLLITACRRDEIGEARWSEVDRQAALLTVPPERYKTDMAHVVPLPAMALAILDALPRIGDSDIIFTTTGRTPSSGYSKAKAALDSRMLTELRKASEERGENPARVTLPPWRLHDLRRSARSRWSAIGIDHDIAERLLGHVIGGIRRVYDAHSYLPEKRAAADRWAAHLQAILNPPEGSNVEPLRRRSAAGGSGQ
jgi:integrase